MYRYLPEIDMARLGDLEGSSRLLVRAEDLTSFDLPSALHAVCESGATDVHVYYKIKYGQTQEGLNFMEALAECQPSLPLVSLSCLGEIAGAPHRIAEHGKGGSFLQLKHLALARMDISDTGARGIVAWLQQPAQSLLSIDLRENYRIGRPEGTECFIPKLATVLSCKSCRITDLNLQGCPVSVKNGASLVRSLRENDTL